MERMWLLEGEPGIVFLRLTTLAVILLGAALALLILALQ